MRSAPNERLIANNHLANANAIKTADKTTNTMDIITQLNKAARERESEKWIVKNLFYQL